MWTPVPTTDRARPKVRSVPTTCAVVSEVSPSRATVPSAPAPEEEKPTSAAMGKVMNPIHLGRFYHGTGNGVGTKVAKDLPAGRKDDDGRQARCKAVTWDRAARRDEKERPKNDSGYAAKQHPYQNAVGDLLTQHLHRYHDQLDHGRIGQCSADRNLHRHMQKDVSIMVP